MLKYGKDFREYKDIVKKIFQEYEIEIDYEKQWEKVMTTTVQRVITLFKNEAKKYQDETK